MSHSRKLACYLAALGASACFAPALSCAQSLSLSYSLDPVRAADTERAMPVVDRCSGLTWAASLAAGCIVQETARTAPPAPSDPAAYTGVTASESVVRRGDLVTVGAEPAPFELPALGSPGGARLIKVKDMLAGAANKTVDFLFRFGSKYRMKTGEDGLEVYKWNDVAQESRLPGTSVKNVGVELLFPFQ